MFETVKPLLRSGRPGDYTHIKNMYRMLVSSCESEKYAVNPRVLIPAGILHDCGYGFVRKQYMRYFTGRQKVSAMKKTANDLTIAYIPIILRQFSFSEKEIAEISDTVRHSDEERLSLKDPSMELQILHDLNLYDRFLSHRLRVMRILYPDLEDVSIMLQKSLANIILPEFKEKAAALMKRFLSEPGLRPGVER